MDYRSYKLTARPSKPDPRDWHITKLVALEETFPEEFRIEYKGKVKDQGAVGSCVAHSICYCREIVQQIQTGIYKQFSVGFVYGNRRITDYQGSGMEAREALKCLKNDGVPYYELFPYNEEYPKPISDMLFKHKFYLKLHAKRHRISAYALLNNEQEIKTALMKLGPVSITIPICKNFYDMGRDAIPPYPGGTWPVLVENLLGYHEVTILGWKKINGKQYWIVLNSWSENWGDYGYFYLPMDFPIVEAWSLTDTIQKDQEEKEVPNPISELVALTLDLVCYNIKKIFNKAA
jgi:hypothetical protein